MSDGDVFAGEANEDFKCAYVQMRIRAREICKITDTQLPRECAPTGGY